MRNLSQDKKYEISGGKKRLTQKSKNFAFLFLRPECEKMGNFRQKNDFLISLETLDADVAERNIK